MIWMKRRVKMIYESEIIEKFIDKLANFTLISN